MRTSPGVASLAGDDGIAQASARGGRGDRCGACSAAVPRHCPRSARWRSCCWARQATSASPSGSWRVQLGKARQSVTSHTPSTLALPDGWAVLRAPPYGPGVTAVITVIRRDPQRWRRGAVSISRNMHDVPTAARSPVTCLVSIQQVPKARANPHAPRGTHRVAWLVSRSVVLFRTVLTLCSHSPRARTRNVRLGEAGRLEASRPHAFTHVRSFTGLGVRRVLVGVEGFQPLGLGWDGGSLPSGGPRRAARALRRRSPG